MHDDLHMVCLGRLHGVKERTDGTHDAYCPFHEDGNGKAPHDPNLRVWPKGFNCSACGAKGGIRQLAERLGIATADPAQAPERASKRIEATYDYVAEDGTLLFQVVRYSPKGFRQRRPDRDTGWAWKLEGVRRVLYRLPDLIRNKDAVVFVVEGEKDADRLAGLGLTATTCAGGANKWRPEYSQALRGRRVVIIPDNDAVGQQHAVQVKSAIQAVAASVKILELPGVPECGGDASDWLDAGGTAEELLRMADGVEPEPEPEPEEEAEDLEPEPEAPTKPRWRFLTPSELHELPRPEWLVTGLVPKRSVGVVFGDSRAYKSFWSLDLAAHLATGRTYYGIPVEEALFTVYLACEGAAGIQLRVDAWAEHHGVPLEDMCLLRVVPDALQLLTDTEAFIDAFKTTVGAGPDEVGLTIIDTLAASMPGQNESSSEAMSGAVFECQRICRALGGTTLAIHHEGLTSGRERGHTSLKCGVDFRLSLTREDDLLSRLRVVKMRDAEDGGEFMVTLEPAGESLAVVDVALAPPQDPDAKTMAQVEPLLDGLRRLDGHTTATAWLHAWQSVVLERDPGRDKPPTRATFNRHLKKAQKLNLVTENGGEYVLK